MFGQIIASNFKLKTNDPKDFNIPWQERVLSVKLFIDYFEIYFHRGKKMKKILILIKYMVCLILKKMIYLWKSGLSQMEKYYWNI